MDANKPTQVNKLTWLIDKHSEEKDGELLQQLTESIAKMLEQDQDLLLSSLYRMDVSEEKIRRLLESSGERDIATGLAELVLERQMESMRTREKYPQPKIEDEEAAI